MQEEISALRDLLKARDVSKLQKKTITNKRGHKTTVYVRAGEKLPGAGAAYPSATKPDSDEVDMGADADYGSQINFETKRYDYVKRVADTGKTPDGQSVPSGTREAAKLEIAKRDKAAKGSDKGSKDIPGGSYHVSRRGFTTGHHPVKGKKVEVHPHLHTFSHTEKEVYAPHQGGMIKNAVVVTEASTGLRMAVGKTEAEAIANAKAEVERIGIDRLKQKLHSTNEQHGVMPGFERGGAYKTSKPHEAENRYKMNNEKQREATWGKLHADKQLIRGSDIKDGYKDAKAWYESVKGNPSMWAGSVESAKKFKDDFIKRGPSMANQKMSDAVYWSGVEKVAKETGTWDEPKGTQGSVSKSSEKGSNTMKAETNNLRSLLKASPLMKSDEVKSVEAPAGKMGEALRDCDKAFIKSLGSIASSLGDSTKERLRSMVQYDLRWQTNAQEIMNRVDAAYMFETGTEIPEEKRKVLVAATNAIVTQNALDRNQSQQQSTEKVTYQPTLAKAAPASQWRGLLSVDRVSV